MIDLELGTMMFTGAAVGYLAAVYMNLLTAPVGFVFGVVIAAAMLEKMTATGDQ